MRVCHLNFGDRWGGASKAADRLHQGLKTIGVDSRMVVSKKESDDEKIHGPTVPRPIGSYYSYFRRQLDKAPLRILRENQKKPFSLSWIPGLTVSRTKRLDPDIIHLHWINGGLLRVEDLAKFDAPLIWTAHDMWPITGGCHYTRGCDRYQDSCGKCPQLNSSRTWDVSRLGYHRKSRVYSDLDVTFIAPSEWSAARIRESSLFNRPDIEVIPNGLDTNFFKPQPRKTSRSKFSIPTDETVILFGADSSNKRKGSHLLFTALDHLSVENITIATFGHETDEDIDSSYPFKSLGWIPNDDLATLYSTADVTVVPSTQEAFGQTASESMACGTPVVGFDVTGVADIVAHERTGYVATNGDAQSLAEGIEFVLDDPERQELLSHNARERAVRLYDQEVVAKRHREVYQSCL